MFLDSLGLYEQVFGSVHSEAAARCHNLAIIYHSLHSNLAQRVDMHHSATAVYEALKDEEKVTALPKIQEVLLTDVEAVKAEADSFLNQAVQILRQSIVVAERTSALDSSETCQQYVDLGVLENSVGNSDIALRLTKHALDIYVTNHGPRHPYIFTLLVRLPLAPSLSLSLSLLMSLSHFLPRYRRVRPR